MVSREDIAWAAGLFEGEGCISLVKRPRDPENKYHTVTLKLSMTDHDVVRKFHEIVQYGHLNPLPRQLPSGKTQLLWSTTRRTAVVQILNTLLPYFGVRRSAKAREAIDYLDHPLLVWKRDRDNLGHFIPNIQVAKEGPYGW